MKMERRTRHDDPLHPPEQRKRGGCKSSVPSMWSNDLREPRKGTRDEKTLRKRVKREEAGAHLFSNMRTTTCSMRGLVDEAVCGVCILFLCVGRCVCFKMKMWPGAFQVGRSAELTPSSSVSEPGPEAAQQSSGEQQVYSLETNSKRRPYLSFLSCFRRRRICHACHASAALLRSRAVASAQ